MICERAAQWKLTIRSKNDDSIARIELVNGCFVCVKMRVMTWALGRNLGVQASGSVSVSSGKLSKLKDSSKDRGDAFIVAHTRHQDPCTPALYFAGGEHG